MISGFLLVDHRQAGRSSTEDKTRHTLCTPTGVDQSQNTRPGARARDCLTAPGPFRGMYSTYLHSGAQPDPSPDLMTGEGGGGFRRMPCT